MFLIHFNTHKRFLGDYRAQSHVCVLHCKVNIDDFTLVKVIGKGSFGKVTLVRKKSDNKLYAMKVLSKANIVKRKQVEHTKTERRVLGSINHPFIVRLHYAFQTAEKLYFVLDYAAGGELFFHLSRVKKFPESTTRFFCAEITLALDAIHAHNVVYRDLKPENILLDGEVSKTDRTAVAQLLASRQSFVHHHIDFDSIFICCCRCS